MKKGLIKGLACLGLAGIMVGGVVGLAGCDNNEEKTYGTGSAHSQTIEKDMFIKIDDTLHKGDIVGYSVSGNIKSGGFEATGFKLNCGQYLISSEFRAYRNEPEKENYDHKCKECF